MYINTICMGVCVCARQWGETALDVARTRAVREVIRAHMSVSSSRVA